jgi:hypothetical protein
VVEVADSTYEWLLIQVYRRASQVAATCLPEFLLKWEQPFGQQLARAHAESGAGMIRLFIFDSLPDSLDERAQEVMFAQVLAGVGVYVFIRGDSPSVTPPPTRLWDFAIIDDGAVVFPTYFRGANGIGANVFFGNADAATDYSEFFERLMLHSTEYGRFVTTNAPRIELPGTLGNLATLLRAYGQSALAKRVQAHVQELDQSRGDSDQRASALHQLMALCSSDPDGLPPGLLDDMEHNPSAASTYGYLRRQVRQLAEADLVRLDSH